VTILDAASASAGTVNADGATLLDPITVKGEGQSPVGPGNGYVATSSLSGTKSDTPLIETPQSISVVTRKQMDDQQVQSVSQPLRYTPGVLAESNGIYDRVDTPYSRGFGLDQYLDGLKVDAQYLATDPWTLDRVEYLRGPASVLYGQASPGGLVNLVSKRPTEDPLHELQIQTGCDNRIQTAFDFGGPITQDGPILYRLNGLFEQNDLQADFQKDRRFLINPAVTFKPDEDTNLTILGGYPDATAA
jgi:iron complex outermembrane receptor protein